MQCEYLKVACKCVVSGFNKASLCLPHCIVSIFRPVDGLVCRTEEVYTAVLSFSLRSCTFHEIKSLDGACHILGVTQLWVCRVAVVRYTEV